MVLNDRILDDANSQCDSARICLWRHSKSVTHEMPICGPPPSSLSLKEQYFLNDSYLYLVSINVGISNIILTFFLILRYCHLYGCKIQFSEYEFPRNLEFCFLPLVINLKILLILKLRVDLICTNYFP